MSKKIFLLVSLCCCCGIATGRPGAAAAPSAKEEGHPALSAADLDYAQAMGLLHEVDTNAVPLYAERYYAEAAELLRSASGQGHWKAAIRLGSLYLTGKGVEPSVGRAFSCYGRAVLFLFKKTALGPFMFLLAVAVVFLCGRQFRALVLVCKTRWLAMWVNRGGAAVQYRLAMRYLHGKGTIPRLSDARVLFEKAATQNYAPAQVEMGRFFKEGRGGGRACRVTAAEWFQRAADQGSAEGLFLVGGCYERGEGLPLNVSRALGFYRMAARAGFREARSAAVRCVQTMTDRQEQGAVEFEEAYAAEHGLER